MSYSNDKNTENFFILNFSPPTPHSSRGEWNFGKSLHTWLKTFISCLTLGWHWWLHTRQVVPIFIQTRTSPKKFFVNRKLYFKIIHVTLYLAKRDFDLYLPNLASLIIENVTFWGGGGLYFIYFFQDFYEKTALLSPSKK